MVVAAALSRKSLQRIVLLQQLLQCGASRQCVTASLQLSATFLQMTRAVKHVLMGAPATINVLVGAAKPMDPSAKAAALAKGTLPAARMVDPT